MKTRVSLNYFVHASLWKDLIPSNWLQIPSNMILSNVSLNRIETIITKL